MRWRSPPEWVQITLASPLLICVALAALVLAPIFLLCWGFDRLCKWLFTIPSQDEWKPWFAWYFVYVTYGRPAPRWAWMETIDRRWRCGWLYSFREDRT